MSLKNALDLLHTGHLVIHREVAYAIVDERLVICDYDSEEHKIIHYYESDQPVNLLFSLFQNFKMYAGKNVLQRPNIPEAIVVENGELFDFSKLLETECPECQTWCGKKTVIRHGRYAKCPGCHRSYWKAPLFSAVQDQYVFKASDAIKPSNFTKFVKLTKKEREAQEELLLEKKIEEKIETAPTVKRKLKF